MVDREAFQEIDYRRMFGSVAKWAAQIDRAERIPEYIAHAFRVAMSGRPGPVVLALPEDMLTSTRWSPMRRASSRWRARRFRRTSRVRACVACRGALAARDRRGQPLGAAAHRALSAFAHANALPVACAFRRQELFDNRDPLYAGDVGIGIDPKLAARVREADVLLVLGERLGEMTTSGYTLLDVPVPKQQLIHVHPSPDELGTRVPANARDRGHARRIPRRDGRACPSAVGRVESAQRCAASPSAPRGVPRARSPATSTCGEIALWLDEHLPPDAIVTNGAGNYATWMHRLFRYRGLRRAARAVFRLDGLRRARRDRREGGATRSRTVLSWNGDGCFMMNGQELATAVQYELGVIFVVIDNGMYGTIRMHQERNYPGRVSGTQLRNPTSPPSPAPTAHTARRCCAPTSSRRRSSARSPQRPGYPALLHVKVDPQALTMNASLDGLRAQGEAARSRS